MRLPLPRRALAALALALLAACGSGKYGSPTPMFEPGLRNGPLIGIVTPTSVVLRWQTDVTTTCQVRYGPATQPTAQTLDVPAGLDHEVTLSGLAPDTLHAYELVVPGQPVHRRRQFWTAPASNQAPVTIVAMGDVGCGCAAQLQAATLLETIDPDVVVVTGDLAYPEASPDAFLLRFLGPYAHLMDHIPFYTCIGNHDRDYQQGQVVYDLLALPRNDEEGTESYYATTYGCVWLAALNSEIGLDNAQSPQVVWFDRALGAATHPWKIAFAHRPIHSRGRHPGDAELNALIVPLMEQHGGDLFLSGHDHNYQRTYPMLGNVPDTTSATDIVDPTGPTYIVTGGAGNTLYDVTPGLPMAALEAAYHVVRLDFEPDQVRIRTVRLDGTLADDCTIRRTP